MIFFSKFLVLWVCSAVTSVFHAAGQNLQNDQLSLVVAGKEHVLKADYSDTSAEMVYKAIAQFCESLGFPVSSEECVSVGILHRYQMLHRDRRSSSAGAPLEPLQEMPALAFGTLPPSGVAEYSHNLDGSVLHQPSVQRVLGALLHGFRHIDTSEHHGNDRELGAALGSFYEATGHRREDFWITAKLYETMASPLTGTLSMLNRVGCKYVDLLLLAVPLELYKRQSFSDSTATIASVWSEMEVLVDRGLVRHIGVSNFGVGDLQALLSVARVRPLVNQVEFHPFLQQPELQAFCAQVGIRLAAYGTLSPLWKWGPGTMRDAVLPQLSAKYGISSSAVLLRFAQQKGFTVATSASSPERLLSYSAALPRRAESGEQAFPATLSPADVALIEHYGRSRKQRAYLSDHFKDSCVLPMQGPNGTSIFFSAATHYLDMELEALYKSLGLAPFGPNFFAMREIYLKYCAENFQYSPLDNEYHTKIADALQKRLRRLPQWLPIESLDGTGSDIAALGPLQRVRSGQNSCVIVRSVLTAAECQAVLDRLADRDLIVEGRSGEAAMAHKFVRAPRVSEIGGTIHSHCSNTEECAQIYPAKAAETERLMTSLFNGTFDVIGRSHAVLNNLARGSSKRVSVPDNFCKQSKALFARFRAQLPGFGSWFGPHMDGFEQGCFGMPSHSQRDFLPMQENYDAESLLSAILILQDSGDQNGWLFNASLYDLTDDKGQPREHVNGASHWIGVHFDNEIYNFFEKNEIKSFSPNLKAGDMYIFSASRVHQVGDIFASNKARVSMATFMSWDDELTDIYAFN